MTGFAELKRQWMKDPKFRAEYEALGPEFELARSLIEARRRAGMTQDEVARAMGTSRTQVARMESGRHRPSLGSLERYAAATRSRLRLQLVAER